MKKRSEECLALSNEILKNIELSELSMENILFRCLRLCRLLNDEKGIKLFTYETSGYPKGPNGIESEVFNVYCRLSGRVYEEKDRNGNIKEYAFTDLLGSLESRIESLKISLESSKDPNISVSSANPYQQVSLPVGNKYERSKIVNDISKNKERINVVKGRLYDYVLNIRNTLEYSNVVTSIIDGYKSKVDDRLKEICPESIKKFMSSYENLQSDNDEDWSNAVHSCRRVLKDVADYFYPVTDVKVITIGKKEILVGDENYINRLIQYISASIDSQTKKDVITSTLENIGNQIDKIYESTNKGTHTTVAKEDAERYVIYTYMLIGDIVSLSFK